MVPVGQLLIQIMLFSHHFMAMQIMEHTTIVHSLDLKEVDWLVKINLMQNF